MEVEVKYSMQHVTFLRSLEIGKTYKVPASANTKSLRVAAYRMNSLGEATFAFRIIGGEEYVTRYS